MMLKPSLSFLLAISASLCSLAACQAGPGATLPGPGPSSAVTPSPTPMPLPIPTPTPAPDQGPQTPPLPPLKALSDADVLKRSQTYRFDEVWLSPEGSKLVVWLDASQSVELRDGRSAYRTASEHKLLDRASGQSSTFEDMPLYWYDEQRYLSLNYDPARKDSALMRKAIGGPAQELARFESFTYVTEAVGSDGQYYGGSFGTGRPGIVQSVDLDTGARRDWLLPSELSLPKVPNGRLTLTPMPASKRVLILEDRTPPAPVFPMPSYSPTSTPAPFEPRAESTSAPVSYLFQLHTETGAVEALPEFQGERNCWPSAAPDGSRFACEGYSSEGYETWLYPVSGIRHERVLPGRLLAWLSPELLLLDRGTTLAVAEAGTGKIKASLAQPSGRSPLYDARSKQLVWWEHARGDDKGPLSVYVQSLRDPERPGDARLLRVFAGEDEELFYQLYSSYGQGLFFVVDRQRLQGPLSLYRIKPDASEFELLYSQPYAPDFRFDPAAEGWQ